MIQIYWAFAFLLSAVSGGAASGPAGDLPTWITDSQGFKRPTEMDAIAMGNGSIETSGTGSRGWLVSLNQKAGHGAEVEVKNLSLNPDSGDFFMISTWPLGTNFKRIKLLTGKFGEPKEQLKRLRIPNTKTLFFLYSASDNKYSPEMKLSFRRYGSSLEPEQPPTENPGKKKETVYEVQLRGRAPPEFAAPEFLWRVKQAVRAAAQRYCAAHNISFNEEIPTYEMVLIHKTTFCPFDWPDRDICTSVKHSVFVSGQRIPGESIILNFQLTADHLKVMWNEDTFPELQQLGITVYQLPPTYSTVGYWTAIIGLAIISSLVVTFIIWKANKPQDTSPERNSEKSDELKKTKRRKLSPSKHQRVPSFMYKDPADAQLNKFNESALMTASEETLDDILKPGLPMKNYLGYIVFGANKAFEDEEDTVEFRQKGSPKS